MEHRPRNPRRDLPLALLAGWISLEAIDAFLIFAIPHGPNFAPEVGPSGEFFISGIIHSLFYLADFALIAVPAYFARSVLSPRHFLSALRGAAFLRAAYRFGVLCSVTSSCWICFFLEGYP
jgi:hypothetical protein